MRCNSRNECNPILSDPGPFHPSLELWEGGKGGLESENVRSPYAICSLDSKMICTNTIPVVKGHRLVSMRPLVSCLFPTFYSNFTVFFDQCFDVVEGHTMIMWLVSMCPLVTCRLLPSFTAILQYFSTSVYIAASAIWEIRRKPPDEMWSPMGNGEDSNFEE